MKIIEYKNTFSRLFTNELVELFEQENPDADRMKIPKQTEIWKRVEQTIYKELLCKINEYRKTIVSEQCNHFSKETGDFIALLNNPLRLKDYVIQKHPPMQSTQRYRINNRHNVLGFILFLGGGGEGGEGHEDGDGGVIFKDQNIKIKSTDGTLVLFPDHIDYLYEFLMPTTKNQYIISGQLFVGK